MTRALTIASPVWREGFPEGELKPGMVFELKDGSLELVGHVGVDCDGEYIGCHNWRVTSDEGRRWVVRWAQVLVFPDGGE